MTTLTETENDEAKETPPAKLPRPWIRQDRRVRRFAMRITVSVAVGVAVAVIWPIVSGIISATNAEAISVVPPAQWPECRRLTASADACWYKVRGRETLTSGLAAGLLGVSEERLLIMNPSWRSSGMAPASILIWRGDIAGGGR